MSRDTHPDARTTVAQNQACEQESDAALLEKLRTGDLSAYEALWRRHVDAALMVARKVAPNRAEDLVSESFLALYHQVAEKGNGPESAFRAYLFTTMRNRAMQWSSADLRLVTADEFESLNEEDGWAVIDTQATSSQLLDAFQALPNRWQRVLWLAEVEQVPRPQIAADLGIKPNAVSALVRRARTGLRTQWLAHAVPASLRDNPAHLAPQVLAEATGEKLTIPKSQYQAHLTTCDTCRELRNDLREQYLRIHRGTLMAAGFAALGVALPAAAPSALTAIGTGSALLVGGAGATMIAASVSLLLVGGSITAGVLLGSHNFDTASDPQDQTSSSSTQQGSNDADSGNKRSNELDKSPNDTDAFPAATHEGSFGRGNSNTNVAEVQFTNSREPSDFYAPPTRPTPLDPNSVTPPPSTGDNAAIPLVIMNPQAETGYIAPVLSGTAAPSALITIEIARPAVTRSLPAATEQFTVLSDDSGAWSFDARLIATDAVGSYSYQAWATVGTAFSGITPGSFEVIPLALKGFESLAPFEPLPLDESSTTGIVFEVAGTPSGSVCLSSIYSGQSATIPLDASGKAVQRIRMLTGGTYYLSFRSCDGNYRGPATEIFVDVEDSAGPIFGPFGPDPTETVFELSAV